MKGWMDRCMDRKIDGLMDGYEHGQRDGWIHQQIIVLRNMLTHTSRKAMNWTYIVTDG